MSQATSPTALVNGQLVNAPSWARLGGRIARGVLYAPVMALLVTPVFNRFNLDLNGYLTMLAFFAGGWAVVVVLNTPSEPVLLVTPSTISVSRWGVQILYRASWHTYPMQPLTPRLGRGGRGGTWTQIDLVDANGWRHHVAFNLIGIIDLQSALMAAGCTVVG